MKISCVCVLAVLAAGCGGAKSKADSSAASAPVTAVQQVVDDLAALRFDRLGNPVVRWDAIPKVVAPKESPHRLLVVLVEYADVGFERFRGDANQGEKLARFYNQRLFDETYSKKNTLSHYYAVQSGGRYHITGNVLAPVKLSGKRAQYGSANRPVGGTWRNDLDPDGMVEEALLLAAKANPTLDWENYDHWDPNDHDGDGVVNESDGYVDHFVLVFAGGGQSSCQLLNKIGDVLTTNVDGSALSKLDPKQRECADRMWPHRDAMRRREGTGPVAGGKMHPRGGVPIKDSLWVYDYNMQSEYTESATFIHEFGHSIGLPDVYSRTSSNSTGAWEVMSSTADPSPQNLSAWSRIQLGWLEPKVILPPSHGGPMDPSAHLGLADDGGSSADDAVMVILPPKKKVIDLTSLPQPKETMVGGSKVRTPPMDATALYSGQGNEMNRTATLEIDLGDSRAASIAFSAWWEIEGGWDFAYVEGSADGGKSWKRLRPVNPKHMPAKHGHDGKNTLPGLTGLSGDLDGDGKNESRSGCDPSAEIKSGEDAAGVAKSPCLIPSWVWVRFDLADLVGSANAMFRIRYYTDAAAVMRGILFNNVELDVDGTADKVELARWTSDGFSPSKGRHELLVPHYYVLEFRDPYQDPGYDGALAEPGYSFYFDPRTQKMMAVASRPRPGVVVWYADGAFAWSENDPAINGPGKGYLLVADGTPSELELPGWEDIRVGDDSRSSHYDYTAPEAQDALKQSFIATVCFIRTTAYLPRGGLPTSNGRCPKRRSSSKADVSQLRIAGKQPKYSYEVINELLPGNRDAYKKVNELVDTKASKKGVSYRLRDRSLRYLHTLDAPFAAQPFERLRVHYEVAGSQLIERSVVDADARRTFADPVGGPQRWINPKLPFGGVSLPGSGFEFDVVAPAGDAPAGTKASLRMRWNVE